MEEEGIGLVLARATELRLRIGNCVHKATNSAAPPAGEKQEDGEVNEAEEGEEAERLFSICDALEALECQLSSLQAMHQDYPNKREAALTEIEVSHEMLVDNLKEYKGEELEVVQEASTFAEEFMKHNIDLLVPPYPSCPPLHLSSFSPRKYVRNGVISSDLSNELKKNMNETEKNQGQSRSRNQGLQLGGYCFGSAAKTVVTLVGMISILRLASLGAKSGTSNAPLAVRSSQRGVRCRIGIPYLWAIINPKDRKGLVKERVE